MRGFFSDPAKPKASTFSIKAKINTKKDAPKVFKCLNFCLINNLF